MSFEDWYMIFKRIYGAKFQYRPYQEKAIEFIREEIFQNQNINCILVRMPCGYGKRPIGEAPFLNMIDKDNYLTRGLVYVLPTRALTKHHTEEIERDAKKIRKDINVLDFHGEEISNYYFYADAAVCTFDVFVGAYARRTRCGYNLEFPLGTIGSSYVVFDEAHMLQDEYLYSHTVMNVILRTLVKSGVPSIIMTATMPEKLKEVIFDGLHEGKDHLEYPPRDELPKLSKDSEQFVGKADVDLMDNTTAEDILEQTIKQDEINNKRILIVCNTVSRACKVYEHAKKLLSKDGLIVLLHSRLVKSKRSKRERLAIEIMRNLQKHELRCEGCKRIIESFPFYIKDNKVYCDNCKPSDSKRVDYVIVVATQVIEAGVDLDSDILITDLAPLDSIIQRSFRCARFPRTAGKIYILHYDGVYKPYLKKLVDKAYEILKGSDKTQVIRCYEKSVDAIDENYKVFERHIPYYELKEFLRYLEGFGLTTYSINWHVLKRIRARPNAFLTLVYIPREHAIGSSALYIVDDVRWDRRLRELRETGRFAIISLDDAKVRSLTYDNIIKEILGYPTRRLILEYHVVYESSFSVDRHHMISRKVRRRRRETYELSDAILHKIGEETYLIALRPVKVFQRPNTIQTYYEIMPIRVNKGDIGKLLEGTYLLNPDYYDTDLGLKMEGGE